MCGIGKRTRRQLGNPVAGTAALRRGAKRVATDAPRRRCTMKQMKQPQQKLTVVPLHFKEAKAFVLAHHRHHRPPVGHKFSIGVADEAGTIRGVCIVGRPVARGLDDSKTLEVTRLATDGCDNACSCLYSAAWRVSKEMGYRRLVTYILETESGTSLRATGWKVIGVRGGGSWSTPTRPRDDKHPLQKKVLWEAS